MTDTVSGLARQAKAPRQAFALTAEALAVITATACQPRVGRGGRIESPEHARRRGLVDIALCRVLSDAGLRRSEAAALVWDDVKRWDDGSGRLRVARSKTDAEARTRLPDAGGGGGFGSDPAGGRGRVGFGLRAVGALDRRAASAPRPRRPGWGRVFSGHSGRVGMARRMAAAGAPTHEIMAQGRWKTARMVEVYTRAEEAGRAAKWLA